MSMLSADMPNPPLEARPLWGPPGNPHRPGRRSAQRLCDVVALATAATFAVPSGEVTAASRRCGAAAFARQSAMYLAHVSFGLNYSEIGRAFGRDRTTAAHACRLIEERRDDPALDAALGLLEEACAALRRRMSAPVQP